MALMVAGCSVGGVPTTATTGRISTTTTTATATTTVTTSLVVQTTSAQPTSTTTAAMAAPDPVSSFVVFMPRGFPEDFSDRVEAIDGIVALGLVRTETLHIVETRTADGTTVDRPVGAFVIPVQGAAVDPLDHVSLLDATTADLVAGLGADEILLGESSAALRRLDVGGRIIFDSGREITVAAIVTDTAFAAEEIVTTDPDLVGGEGSELRFAMVLYDGTEAELTSALGLALPSGAGFGVHPRGLPSDQATAVRSQVWIKQTFGEFSYLPSANGGFTLDPTWVEENIVVTDIPLLGTARCHRVYAELLTEVMNSLIASGDESAIDRSAYRGCWNPRYVADSRRLSRHSWGAAADINFFNSLDGGDGSPVNQELLDAMAAVGITSGHAWSIPDPGHFEFYGFPENE